MRVKFLFVFTFLLITACSPILAPTPTDSGINGQVTIGPTCPVVRINNPCPDKPYQATLTILTSDGQHKVMQFQTDANGNFQVALSPGNYVLHPEAPNVMPHARDTSFMVEAHQFTRLDVVYDSGIR
ncbi:MAG TPA: carboxypeptidase-like regulatory domain-containing protein [Anaerolineales bacterium]